MTTEYPPPAHLDDVGASAWHEAIARLTAARIFDARDLQVVESYAELVQLERAAWGFAMANPANDKANLNYARLQKQRLAMLDAMGLSAKSRAKLGIERTDEAADEMAAFLDG